MIGIPLLIGLVIVFAEWRSRTPRRDLLLLAIPAFVWLLAHLTILQPPTRWPLVNAVLLAGPLILAFLFLASHWGAYGGEG